MRVDASLPLVLKRCCVNKQALAAGSRAAPELLTRQQSWSYRETPEPQPLIHLDYQSKFSFCWRTSRQLLS